MFPGFAVQNGSGVSGNGEIGKSENRSIGPFVGMAHGTLLRLTIPSVDENGLLKSYLLPRWRQILLRRNMH